MTHDIKALAVRLAKDAGVERCDCEPQCNLYATSSVELEAIVRAAVAHGLRMGADICRDGVDVQHPTVANHVMCKFAKDKNLSDALRAKADEMERQS